MERIGEADWIIFNREFCRSKSITCTGMSQFRNDDDITSNGVFDRYLFLADQGKHLAQLFFRILGHVIQLIPFFEFAGENADITQFPGKGVDECLKYKSRKQLVRIYHNRFARLFIRSHHDLLGCVRHITDDAPQKFRRSDMMDCTAAHDRAYPAGQHALAQALAQFVDGQFFPFQVFFQQFVVAFCSGFHAHFTNFTGFRHIFCRHFDFFGLAFFPFPGNHFADIDDAAEIIAFSDRNLKGHNRFAENSAHLFEAAKEIGVFSIHFIDIDHARQL